MKVKEESEKVGLKLNIQKTNIMASGHHFMANGETVETVTDCFWGLQNHCDSSDSMKLKDAYSLEGKL